MKWNRARWSGLAALALVGGLLTPVAMAPSAQAAAPVIASSTIIPSGATGQIDLVVTSSTNDFYFFVDNNNFIFNFTTTNLRNAGGASRDPNNPRQVRFPLQPNAGGSAQVGVIEITARSAAFDPPPGTDSNMITVPVTTPPPSISFAPGSEIVSGSVNPSITIETTSAFASTITDDSFTVTAPGTTGLSLASVADVGAGEVTLNFSGTAGNGEIDVTADASAFDPAAGAASNTLTIGLSPVIATTSTISSGAVNPTVVLTSNTSTFVGSPTVNDVDLQPITGLSVGSVTRDSSTQLTVTLAGTAPTTGTVRITALQSGFNDPGTASNTVEIAISSGGGGGGGGTPATPPSAPTSAEATAGNGEATVTWQAPTSQGSFPVTNYQVQSTPSSRGCVVPVTTTSCRIVGLRNGTAYTFQVRALNGGGWGSWATTASVTPGPGPGPDASIIITGSRSANDRVARVRGETTGLVGATVQSMVRLSDRVEFTSGTTRVVGADGRFAWQRRVNPQATVEVYFTAGQVESNKVTIAGRR
jgi:hypothetical protein